MIATVKIKEIMNSKIIVLHPKDSISEAQDTFNRYHIHHIPVAVNRKLVGILSLGDLLAADKILQSQHPDKFPLATVAQLNTIEDIMTPYPYYIMGSDHLSKALEIMKEKRINCLPVIENGLLSGIVTSFDMINYLSKNIESACE